MSSNCANDKALFSTASGGNTKPQNQHQAARVDKKKVINPAKRWCFTIYNFNDKTWQDDIRSMFQRYDKFVVGKEICPKTQNIHLQGYCNFQKKERPLVRFRAKFPGIHFEVAKGNDYQNAMYCSKDGDYILQNMVLTKPFNPDSLINLYQKECIDNEDLQGYLTRTQFHDFVFEMIIKQKVNYPASIARQKEVSDVAYQVCCMWRSMTIKSFERECDELITKTPVKPERSLDEILSGQFDDELTQVEFDDDGKMCVLN